MTQTKAPQSDEQAVRLFIDAFNALIRLIGRAMRQFPDGSEEKNAVFDGLARIYQFTHRPLDDRSDDGRVLWPPRELVHLGVMTRVLGNDVATVLAAEGNATLADRIAAAGRVLGDALRDLEAWREAERKRRVGSSAKIL